MTNAKLIVIWGSDNLLSTFLEGYLAINEDWQIVHAASKKALEAAIRAAAPMQPEIVLIGQRLNGGASNLPLHVIQQHPEIKVIMICLDSNILEVNDQLKVLIKHPSDLITVIENQPSALGGLVNVAI